VSQVLARSRHRARRRRLGSGCRLLAICTYAHPRAEQRRWRCRRSARAVGAVRFRLCPPAVSILAQVQAVPGVSRPASLQERAFTRCPSRFANARRNDAGGIVNAGLLSVPPRQKTSPALQVRGAAAKEPAIVAAVKVLLEVIADPFKKSGVKLSGKTSRAADFIATRKRGPSSFLFALASQSCDADPRPNKIPLPRRRCRQTSIYLRQDLLQVGEEPLPSVLGALVDGISQAGQCRQSRNRLLNRVGDSSV
jgi:hypothetical protein